MTREKAKNYFQLYRHGQKVRKFNLNPDLASGQISKKIMD